MAMSLSGDSLSLNALRFAPTVNAVSAPTTNTPAPTMAADSLSLSGALATNDVAAAEAVPAATHTVAAGDTLSQIAKDQLGDASRWTDIYSLNQDQIQNPDLIFPGQELKMPATDAPAAGAVAAATAEPVIAAVDDTTAPVAANPEPSVADDDTTLVNDDASTVDAPEANAQENGAGDIDIASLPAATPATAPLAPSGICTMRSHMELVKLRQQLAQVERELDGMIQQSGMPAAPTRPWNHGPSAPGGFPGRRPQNWMTLESPPSNRTAAFASNG